MKVSDELLVKYITYEKRREEVLLAAQKIKCRMLADLIEEQGEDFKTIGKIGRKSAAGQEVAGFLMMTMLFLGVPLLCMLFVTDLSTLNWPMLRLFIPFGILSLGFLIYTSYQKFTLNRRIKKLTKSMKKGELSHGKATIDV